MGKKVLTDEHKAYIEANRLTISPSTMAEQIGCSTDSVRRHLKRVGLQVSRETSKRFFVEAMTGRTSATPGEDAHIQANYLKSSIKGMAKAINRTHVFIKKRMEVLGLEQPAELVEANRIAHRIKPGQAPFNKGMKVEEFMAPEHIEKMREHQFKKGKKNFNELHDGAIRKRNVGEGQQQYYIRTEKAKWIPLQRHRWIQANGPIPDKHVLRCIDGDQLNTDPSNWKAITMAENAKYNSGHDRLEDKYVAMLLAGRKFKHLRQEFEKHPHLIELKRKQIIFKRQIDDTRRANKKD